jgi:hypothetical protein
MRGEEMTSSYRVPKLPFCMSCAFSSKTAFAEAANDPLPCPLVMKSEPPFREKEAAAAMQQDGYAVLDGFLVPRVSLLERPAQ